MFEACIGAEDELGGQEIVMSGTDDEGVLSEPLVASGRDDLMKQARRQSSALFGGDTMENELSTRRGHLEQLIAKNSIRNKHHRKRLSIMTTVDEESVFSRQARADEEAQSLEEDTAMYEALLSAADMEEMEKAVEREGIPPAFLETEKILATYGLAHLPKAMMKQPLEVRIKGLTFRIPVRQAGRIETVYTSSPVYPLVKIFKRLILGENMDPQVGEKAVLKNVNLVLKPGKSYLVLGPPSSGKTTLLRAIAGLLKPREGAVLEGSISYNGRELKEKEEFHIENLMAYIDQIDQHAPRLTVFETFDFANNCVSRGKFLYSDGRVDAKTRDGLNQADKERIRPKLIASMLGLKEVQDTFVGNTFVRGVSGGQRRRVTVGEMLQANVTVLCGDEISTGLDAASTYDMVQCLTYTTHVNCTTKVISLLQPSPETVSLFDIVIVLAKGQIIYHGPVRHVADYFAAIGFVCPPFMDIADFLQVVSTDDSTKLYHPNEEQRNTRPDAPSPDELADIFRESERGGIIQEELAKPSPFVWKKSDSVGPDEGAEVSPVAESKHVKTKYRNHFFRSTWLIYRRFLILWLRDTRVIMASAAKNIIMGVSVGGIYFNTMDPISIQGALFQAGLFIMLGSMQSAGSLIEDRVTMYKHSNSNFYSAWPFVVGRTLAMLPQIFFDTLTFSILLYYMIGLADRNEAGNFFLYFALLLTFAVLMNQQMAVFASFASSGSLSALGACIVLVFILFGGFIVPPNAIPNYFLWAYWWNPFSWIYRGLTLNEFLSERWQDLDPDTVLVNLGFIGPDGAPFESQWMGYAFAYAIPYTLLCLVITGINLTLVRVEGGTAVEPPPSIEKEEKKERIELPFKPVTLSILDMCYEVSASTSSEKLKLLSDVSGAFRAGTMTALMGSSGAGKTTLMDVIALRKRTGTVTGEVRLNGWPQEPISFRRASGYVEQFDVQSAQLTVRETVLFSARLRLDPSVVSTDEQIEAFVDQVMDDVELSTLADCMVGSDEGFGLSFEQKKRLSIAVEVAASPSVLFLDEPTSGLDSRSALIVARVMRKIATSGRTLCATIHQPSSSLFEMFDYLLLLKKGGKVVYHGPLGGKNCSNLVSYFESRGAPQIELGDNPANWMLRVVASEGQEGLPADLAESYAQSEEHAALRKELEELHAKQDASQKLEYDSEFAVGWYRRQTLVNNRMQTIYWRSPGYNYSRILVSLVIAFVLGSVFITQREPPYQTESGMRARLSVVFLTFIISGIMAILSIIPVMYDIRDMYYRHQDAGMYGSSTMGLALGVAEKWFIVGSSALFCTVFLATCGLLNQQEPPIHRFSRYVVFWGFYTFNSAIYSYFGQLFVCLVKPSATAFILSSVFIGINNFFSGLVARPQIMVGTFYAIPFYISPGHYVYDGMVAGLYRNNNETVRADMNSEFYQYLDCHNTTTSTTNTADDAVCEGTAFDYITWFFGGIYGQKVPVVDILVLAGFLIVGRLFTWVALRFLRHA